jgi:hypothetical protein
VIRRRQLFMHDPDNGVFGDCHRAAIACVLDMEPEQVPHFAELAFAAEQRGEQYDWREDVERFLNAHGLTQADVQFGGATIDELFDYMEYRNPKIRYLLGGMSPRGTHHTVICVGNTFEWDPHPSDGFLVGPMEHGFWEVTFLLPLAMRAEVA